MSTASKLDLDFTTTMLEIEKLYEKLQKHEKIRVQQWSKKLCQVTTNPAWKKNRNIYAEILLEMVLSGSLDEPFSKVPPDGSLPVISRANFTFLRRAREEKPAAARPPRVHSASTRDLAHVEAVSLTPRSVKQVDPPQAESPPTRPLVTIEPLAKSPSVKVFTKPQAVVDEITQLKAKLEIAVKNEQYLREELLRRSKTVSEQQRLIEELKVEISQLKRKEEKGGRPAGSQRYSSYIDNFERETAKIAEETLALQQGLRRKSEKEPQKPNPHIAKRHYESLEEALGIDETLKGMKELEKMQRRLKMEAEDFSREESLNYSNRSSEDAQAELYYR